MRSEDKTKAGNEASHTGVLWVINDFGIFGKLKWESRHIVFRLNAMSEEREYEKNSGKKIGS